MNNQHQLLELRTAIETVEASGRKASRRAVQETLAAQGASFKSCAAFQERLGLKTFDDLVQAAIGGEMLEEAETADISKKLVREGKSTWKDTLKGEIDKLLGRGEAHPGVEGAVMVDAEAHPNRAAEGVLPQRDAVLDWPGHRTPEAKRAELEEKWAEEEKRHAKAQQVGVGNREATWDFGNKPVLISSLSDWHVGSISTNHELIRKHVDLITSTPRSYAVSVGDILENHFAIRELVNDTELPEQILLAALMLQKLSPRLLGVVGGNHDCSGSTRIRQTLDLMGEVIEQISPGLHQVPSSADYLYLNLKCGNFNHLHEIRHRTNAGSTQTNTNHGAIKHLRFSAKRDIEAIHCGHTHSSSGVQEVMMLGKKRYVFQTASYKVRGFDQYDSTFAFRDENLHPAFSFILFPDTEELVTFNSLEVGHAYFKSVVCPEYGISV